MLIGGDFNVRTEEEEGPIEEKKEKKMKEEGKLENRKINSVTVYLY